MCVLYGYADLLACSGWEMGNMVFSFSPALSHSHETRLVLPTWMEFP